MSLYDFSRSLELKKNDEPFYALIMAAMLRADDYNTAKLKTLYPDIYKEVFDRYNAPGGVLPGDN